MLVKGATGDYLLCDKRHAFETCMHADTNFLAKEFKFEKASEEFPL